VITEPEEGEFVMNQRNKLMPRVGVGSLASPLEVGAELAAEAAANLAERLENAGCIVVAVGAIDTPARATAAGRRLAEEHVDAIGLAPASWFEDYLVLDLLEECSQPLLLWPLPGMEIGALCGTQQSTAYLKQLQHPYKSVFDDVADNACLTKAMSFLRAAALKSHLRRARIGMAGNHINGMTHTAPNEFMLKKVIGPRVVFLDLPLLLKSAGDKPEQKARERWQELVGRAGKCEVAEAEGIDAMRVHAALEELIQEHGLDALTIGCYPHLMGRVCIAASLLADKGIPMACEGDVHGAIGQLMLSLLTDQPTHNTDWLEPMEDGTVIFTHCGAGSFSLAARKSDVSLSSVRLMGQGVCALFPAKPGPVTLIGFVAQPAGYQCALLEGEALDAEMVFPGNPVRVRFDRPTSQIIDWIHEQGIGHHWMIGYGHLGAHIRDWANIIGDELRLVNLEGTT